jgi:5-methyltetrahydropteroyltriglutamate--homocysteine methyltransferase
VQIILTNQGSYPRIGDRADQQRLRKATHLWEQGKWSQAQLREVQQQTTRDIIAEQIEAGIELVTEGQICWYDPISHLLRDVPGVEINGLLRFFDTNFYFRQPIIKGRCRWETPLILEEFLFASSVSALPVKPVLTGPYTLADHSICLRDRRDVIMDLAGLIGQEVSQLAKHGATWVQIDEPSILRKPHDFALFREAIGLIASMKAQIRLALYTYFGNAGPLYDEFQGLEVDALGFDFTYSPDLWEIISSSGSDKIIAFGIVDGRNTKLEPVKGLVAQLQPILSSLNPSAIFLNPSCGLEYLPRDCASKKLKLLRDLKQHLL